MRWFVIAALVALAAPAHADDGYYLTEALGGAGYRGELGRYSGAPRFSVGFAVRRSAWTIEAFGAATIPDFYAIDCYGDECAAFERPTAGLAAFGVDLRRRLRLLWLSRWARPGVYERPGVFVTLHGGVRHFEANGALDGYRGPGLGVGAALEGDLWILGYFVDVGIDAMRLVGPGEPIHGSTPYLMFGAKLGWL